MGHKAGDFKPGDTLTATVETDEEGKQMLHFEVTASAPIEEAGDDEVEELLQFALA